MSTGWSVFEIFNGPNGEIKQQFLNDVLPSFSFTQSSWTRGVGQRDRMSRIRWPSESPQGGEIFENQNAHFASTEASSSIISILCTVSTIVHCPRRGQRTGLTMVGETSSMRAISALGKPRQDNSRICASRFRPLVFDMGPS